jgi:SAM-dependent methyltransferase
MNNAMQDTYASLLATEENIPFSTRKAAIRQLANEQAQVREKWIVHNIYYYTQDYNYMRFLVPQGLRVLDLGCGTGRLLAELRPSYGVGIDFSPRMIDVARHLYPKFQYHVGDVEDPATINRIEETFDVIVLSDTIGSLADCQQTLEQLHPLCHQNTRVIIAYYSQLWEPILKLGDILGLRMPQIEQNWLSTDDIINLLNLADFDVIKREWRQLLPKQVFGLSTFINRYLAPLPGIRRACLRNYIVARPIKKSITPAKSISIVIPCRNERGNIEAAIQRIPDFCDKSEIIYVEGHSSDGTLTEIERVIAAYPEKDIKVLVQDGKGKGDAVRKAFATAQGDILMILDADLTMPPEALPKFYHAIVSGKGEFINGSRLVYPMEKTAMRFLNHIANRFFAWAFSWLLNQHFTDTLCGTKVLSKAHYQEIAANRSYFGEFDPFGDFDLLFGAAKLNLKIVEIPITYAGRTYGETQISRFRHGWLLLRMVIFAFRKLKAF